MVGIAVGFGAQTLVRDLFSGASYLIEDVFRIGDYIEGERQMHRRAHYLSYDSAVPPERAIAFRAVRIAR